MDSQSDSQSKDQPKTFNPTSSLSNVLTMRADRLISYQVIKLAYEIGMLQPEEVTGGHPAITELRQLVKSWKQSHDRTS